MSGVGLVSVSCTIAPFLAVAGIGLRSKGIGASVIYLGADDRWCAAGDFSMAGRIQQELASWAYRLTWLIAIAAVVATVAAVTLVFRNRRRRVAARGPGGREG